MLEVHEIKMASVEEIIRRAMEEGQFDDLAGKGKPLKLEENFLEDPDWRMANHVLKSSGFSPPWVETRRDLEQQIEKVRSDLTRAWKRYLQTTAKSQTAVAKQEWERAVQRFHQEVAKINRQIFSYNLQAPLTRFQRPLLSVERELERTTHSSI
jgi:DnaJ family protein C protein 28